MTIDYKFLFGTIAMFMGFLFPFWPLVVIAPIQRRRYILYYMTAAWGMMALVWVVSRFAPYRITFHLIPEPFDSILFFVAGAVLIAVQIGKRYWQHRDLQIKADQVKSADDLHRLSPTEFENMVVEFYAMMGH